jgi:hypothetical protein
MADKEETGLIPGGDSPPPVPEEAGNFPERVEEINALYRKFILTIKKGALLAFGIGEKLKETWDLLGPADSWPQWCRDNLDFGVSTANRYLRIYENFRDRPKELAGLTADAALKQLSAPRDKTPKASECETAGGQQELPWERYFELPPLSREVKLSNHRFEIPNSHELYLIRRGLGYPVKIAEVLAPEDRRLKTAHRGMLEEVQAALERYYQEVERIEALEGQAK